MALARHNERRYYTETKRDLPLLNNEAGAPAWVRFSPFRKQPQCRSVRIGLEQTGTPKHPPFAMAKHKVIRDAASESWFQRLGKGGRALRRTRSSCDPDVNGSRVGSGGQNGSGLLAEDRPARQAKQSASQLLWVTPPTYFEARVAGRDSFNISRRPGRPGRYPAGSDN